MPVPLARAAAAIQALRGLNGSALFAMMQSSDGYLFEKHVTKGEAIEAAKRDGGRKSYVKRVQTVHVADLAQYRALSERQREHMTGLPKGKKPESKHFGPKKDVRSVTTETMSTSDFANLLALAIKSSGQLRANNDRPEERFRYIVPMPDGYVGRSITLAGEKEKSGIAFLVLIVVAPATGNSLVFNMFACDAAYIGGTPAPV